MTTISIGYVAGNADGLVLLSVKNPELVVADKSPEKFVQVALTQGVACELHTLLTLFLETEGLLPMENE